MKNKLVAPDIHVIYIYIAIKDLPKPQLTNHVKHVWGLAGNKKKKERGKISEKKTRK